MLFADAMAVIPKADFDRAIVVGGRDMNIAIFVNGLICVGDHVGEDLIQLAEVTFDLWQLSVINMYLRVILGLVTKNIDSTTNTFVDVHQIHFTAVFTGEGFKIGNNLFNPLKPFNGLGGKTFEIHQQILDIVSGQPLSPGVTYFLAIQNVGKGVLMLESGFGK